MALNRLNLAKELGADLILQIQKTDTEAKIVKIIHNLLGEAPDRTLDCSGFEATNRLSILVSQFLVVLSPVCITKFFRLVQMVESHLS